MIEARKPGDGKLKPIEDAPGSYVKSRASDMQDEPARIAGNGAGS